MPNQHLNGSTIENNQWEIAPEAAEQTTRLAEQTQLQVADATAINTLQTLETWTTATEKKNLLVSGDAEIADIEAAIEAAGQAPKVIFIDFPVFTDGRGYSLARLLKRAEWFNGKLAAIGDVLQDQVYFFWRCGFDVIVPRHDQNIENCQKALNSFSHVYQPAVNNPAAKESKALEAEPA